MSQRISGPSERGDLCWKGPDLPVERIFVTPDLIEWPCSLRMEFHWEEQTYTEIIASLLRRRRNPEKLHLLGVLFDLKGTRPRTRKTSRRLGVRKWDDVEYRRAMWAKQARAKYARLVATPEGREVIRRKSYAKWLRRKARKAAKEAV